eukprot:4054679-Alexandrium_andersonii.AAC.1
MAVNVASSQRVLDQLRWADAGNMNRAVMSPTNTLEAERAQIIDPLIERWLGRPRGRLGRFAGPQA